MRTSAHGPAPQRCREPCALSSTAQRTLLEDDLLRGAIRGHDLRKIAAGARHVQSARPTSCSPRPRRATRPCPAGVAAVDRGRPGGCQSRRRRPVGRCCRPAAWATWIRVFVDDQGRRTAGVDCNLRGVRRASHAEYIPLVREWNQLRRSGRARPDWRSDRARSLAKGEREAQPKPITVPDGFLRFIGAAELAGAIGVIAHGQRASRHWLTLARWAPCRSWTRRECYQRASSNPGPLVLNSLVPVVLGPGRPGPVGLPQLRPPPRVPALRVSPVPCYSTCADGASRGY